MLKQNKSYGALLSLLAVAAIAAAPEMAHASTSSNTVPAFENAICRIIDVIQGPVARGIAAIGIIFLGFGLFLGKVSWGVALALGIGIAAIFGADAIVKTISGETGNTCDSSVATIS